MKTIGRATGNRVLTISSQPIHPRDSSRENHTDESRHDEPHIRWNMRWRNGDFGTNERSGRALSFIIIDPAGMVPLVALRRTKKPGSARAGTCRDHAINGPRSWTTQSRGTPAIDAQRLNWLRRRRAIRSGGGAHPLAATRRLLRSVMVGA